MSKPKRFVLCSVNYKNKRGSGMDQNIDTSVEPTRMIGHPAMLMLGPEETAALITLASRLTEQSHPNNRSNGELVDLAYWIYKSRRSRDRYFESELFAEPAWDILLAAYCLESPNERLTVSSLCYSAGCPFTTALRWIDRLENHRLLERRKSESDGRKIYAFLTRDARNRIESYLRQVATRLQQERRSIICLGSD
jgi:DNA-binding MarR family transcriptional regulator